MLLRWVQLQEVRTAIILSVVFSDDRGEFHVEGERNAANEKYDFKEYKSRYHN